MSDLIRDEQHGDVALLTMDDGKANALSHAMIDALDAGLDRAEADASALVLAGREGRFSAGFDLSVMQAGPEAARALVAAGGRLCARLYTLPVPVVVACTGHALAGGALLVLSGDHRVGAAGDFKIGLNEVAIGLPLPQFAIDLAEQRLSRRHVTRATVLAHIYPPDEAVDAGYLDSVVADPVPEALDVATELTARLSSFGFAGSRRTARQAVADKIVSELEADLAHFGLDPDA
ncbi:MAG: crotonase/enoyl-CoA hydratase family protein [Acidimicrobiia bacterium]|nr:crotonase/enoyl-CoA hydratase family protein [Acidimicrobiia bacterium]